MTVEIAIQLVLALIDRAGAISQMIQTAKATGQTTLSEEQWKEIVGHDDAARAALATAIMEAQAATIAKVAP